ncbi:MAG: hypothetical protein AAF718_17645 [Pseudomonadota bacterium]
MNAHASSDILGPDDIAEVLTNIASLMQDFHRSDEALQVALSSLAEGTDTAPTLFELQHVDLLTQSHFDLGKLMSVLAEAARGKAVNRGDLRDALTLRSLQDSLIDSQAQPKQNEAGELSLF